jgi:ABC-2 type transport system permease protein
MILLSPIIMVLVFGSMTMRIASNPSPFARPLMASGAIVMVLFSLMQLAGNQFGFDRSGFRNFVLASAPRREILLGKNLSLAPLALGMSTLVIVLVQVVYPMRIDHFMAVLAQMISMYFVFCLIANILSIIAPTPMASGSLKPAKPKGITILIHLAFFFLFPLALAPTLIPLGLEFLLSWLGWNARFPVYLLFSMAELVVVAYLYPLALSSQGDMLQSREQRILEIVTANVE